MSEKKLVERIIELGLGIAAYSEDKISEFIGEITSLGEEKKKKMEDMKTELKEKVSSFQKEFDKRVRSEVKTVMDKMHLVTTEDIDEIKRRLEELEKKDRC